MKSESFEPVTREMVAALLKVSLGTVDKHVRDGDLPPPRSIGRGRKLYWDPEVLYPRLRQCLNPSRATGEAGNVALDVPPPEATPAHRPSVSSRGTSAARRSAQRTKEQLAKLNQ